LWVVLKRLHELGDLAFEAIEEGVLSFIAFDKDGRIITCNPAFIELSGFSKQELGKMKWPDDLIAEKNIGSIRDELRTVRCNRGSDAHQWVLKRKDGSECHIETFLQAICDDKSDISLYYSFVYDITNRVIETKKNQASIPYCRKF